MDHGLFLTADSIGRTCVDNVEILHKLYTDLSTSCGLFAKVGNAFDSPKTRAYNCK